MKMLTIHDNDDDDDDGGGDDDDDDDDDNDYDDDDDNNKNNNNNTKMYISSLVWSIVPGGKVLRDKLTTHRCYCNAAIAFTIVANLGGILKCMYIYVSFSLAVDGSGEHVMQNKFSFFGCYTWGVKGMTFICI